MKRCYPLKLPPYYKLSENTVSSQTFREVTVMYGRYQLTSYEKLLILLRVLVYRKYVQPCVLMPLLVYFFVA
jgi:hypothetical protein